MAEQRNDREAAENFRDLCRERGLAFTHQRLAIYQAAEAMDGHPTPEAIYERVRQDVPALSLATVYKNLKTFVETGLMREVSLHHGSARLDANIHPHHHLVCERCKSIVDLPLDAIDPVRVRGKLPDGFRVDRHSVDIIGICAHCADRQS